MKKFVCYLYAYQNGKRTQNVGFVKCEANGNFTRLQIYGKGFSANGDDQYELFVFYPMDGKCIGVSMGTLKNTSPVFSYRLEYNVADMDGQELYDKVEGIILVKGEGNSKRTYAAKWTENDLNIEQMMRKEELLIEEVMVEEEIPREETISEENDSIEEADTPEGLIRAAEDIDKKEEIFKIMRQDMAKLPRCEWKLANNHFLLHGYYNYHHLLSFKKDGFCWLGVPGVFHPNEQKVAKAFGFEKFIRLDASELSLSQAQKEDGEEFGYWCRMVTSVIEG